MGKRGKNRGNDSQPSKRETKRKNASGWRSEVVKIDIHNVHPARTCETVIIAELISEHASVLERFHYASFIDPNNVVKSITYNDLVAKVRLATHPDYVTDTRPELLFKKACEEAKKHLKYQRQIPNNLIAILAKMRLTCMINEDVVARQREIIIEQQKEADCIALKYEPLQNERKRNGKGGKGKNKSPKKSAETVKQINKVNPNIQVDPKELYFALMGFYDSNLLAEFLNIGLPITCVIEVSEPGDILRKPGIMDPDLPFFSFTCNTAKDNILFAYWSKLFQLFDGEGQHNLLENTMHLQFCPPKMESTPEITYDLKKQSIEIFSKLGDLILRIPDFKRHYVNYTRKLKILDIGCKPNAIRASSLKTYNKMMDRVPPDSFSIGLLLHSLVEEVRARVPDPPNPKVWSPLCSVDSITISRDSIFLESDTEDIDSPSSSDQSIVDFHSGFKDNAIELLERYLKRYTTRHKPRSVNHQIRAYMPRINLKITKTPFILHENNCLEMMVNAYKKISRNLFQINIDALKKCAPIFLWELYHPRSAADSLVNEHRLQRWSKNLKLSKEELIDRIHALLMLTLKCKNHIISVQEVNALFKNCFHRNPDAIMTAAKPKTNACHLDIPPILTSNRVIEKPKRVSSDDTITAVNQGNGDANIHESMHVAEYKWIESLSGSVMLQEIHDATINYLCFDHKYCHLSDTILLRFHNDVDPFGVNTTIWNQPLRTPVCFRDFYKYIVFDESEWLNKEENRYREEQKRKLEIAEKEKEKIKKSILSDTSFDEGDFFEPSSFKRVIFHEEKHPIPQKSRKNTKKGKAGKKPSDKKSKATHQMSTASILEHLHRPEPLVESKYSLRCAKTGEPYHFLGFDVGNNRSRVTGTTTTFHSMDGVKVTVNHSGWLGESPTLSLNVSVNGHDLIFHCNSKTRLMPVTFHFNISNGAIVAFGKSLLLKKPEVSVCEKIYETLQRMKKGRNSAYKPKRQEMYFISERLNYVLKAINIPRVTSRTLIMPHHCLRSFLENAKKFNIKTNVRHPIPLIPKALTRGIITSKTPPNDNTHAKILTLRYTPKGVIKKYCEIDIAIKDEYVPRDGFYLKPIVIAQKQPVTKSEFKEQLIIKTKKEFLRILKTVMESHVPIFKIYSSKLHKYEYVRRIKTLVEVPLGKVLMRVACKAPYCRTKRCLTVTKCFPLSVPDDRYETPMNFDMRASLPSGLYISSIAGMESLLFHIKQKYLDKGPQCKNIAAEDSRSFMRDGNIVIKKCDGTVNILGVSGMIINFEIPCLKKLTVIESKYKTKINKHAQRKCNYVPLQAGSHSLTKFQKILQLQKTIRRHERHVIDGSESRYLASRRSYLRAQKKYLKDPKKMYLIKTNLTSLPGYSVLTSQGRKIKISQNKISEEMRYFMSEETDYLLDEIFIEREDGMRSVLNRHSVLCSQFPDGTKITTWFSVSPDLVFIDDCIIEEQICAEGKQHERQQTSKSSSSNATPRCSKSENIDTDGWVYLYLYYKYEHPNYATVIYGGSLDTAEIVLPGDVKLLASSGGDYSLDIDRHVLASVDPQTVRLESQICTDCNEKCISILNISHFYDETSPEPDQFLLRTCDSYDKTFTVDFDGRCAQHVEDEESKINKAGCLSHCKTSHDKIFVMKRNLSGDVFWDDEMFSNYYKKVRESGGDINKFYRDKNLKEYSAVEFKIRSYQPYHERFCVPYPKSHLTFSCDIGYRKSVPLIIEERVLNIHPDIDTLKPFYIALIKQNLDACLNCDTFSLYLKKLLAENLKVHDAYLQKLKRLEMEKELSPPHFRSTLSLYEKWCKWQQECKKYKKQITDRDIPSYFKSIYGCNFIQEQLTYFANMGEGVIYDNFVRSKRISDRLKAMKKNAFARDQMTSTSSLISTKCVRTDTKKVVEELQVNNNQPKRTSEERYPTLKSDMKMDENCKESISKLVSDEELSLSTIDELSENRENEKSETVPPPVVSTVETTPSTNDRTRTYTDYDGLWIEINEPIPSVAIRSTSEVDLESLVGRHTEDDPCSSLNIPSNISSVDDEYLSLISSSFSQGTNTSMGTSLYDQHILNVTPASSSYSVNNNTLPEVEDTTDWNETSSSNGILTCSPFEFFTNDKSNSNSNDEFNYWGHSNNVITDQSVSDTSYKNQPYVNEESKRITVRPYGTHERVKSPCIGENRLRSTSPSLHNSGTYFVCDSDTSIPRSMKALFRSPYVNFRQHNYNQTSRNIEAENRNSRMPGDEMNYQLADPLSGMDEYEAYYHSHILSPAPLYSAYVPDNYVDTFSTPTGTTKHFVSEQAGGSGTQRPQKVVFCSTGRVITKPYCEVHPNTSRVDGNTPLSSGVPIVSEIPSLLTDTSGGTALVPAGGSLRMSPSLTPPYTHAELLKNIEGDILHSVGTQTKPGYDANMKTILQSVGTQTMPINDAEIATTHSLIYRQRRRSQ